MLSSINIKLSRITESRINKANSLIGRDDTNDKALNGNAQLPAFASVGGAAQISQAHLN